MYTRPFLPPLKKGPGYEANTVSVVNMSELHKYVSTTVESLNSLSSYPESRDNFGKLETDLESTLAPYKIHYSPEATSMFLNNILKAIPKALIENIIFD